MTIGIRTAESADDYAVFGELCRAYIGWCRERYAGVPWLVEEVFGHQSFEDELKGLATKYGPPKGKTLLALRDGRAIGGGAYHQLADGVCELKRLYVADEARGLGVGRQLSESLMASAKAEGFTVMRLDTGNLLNEAIAMYHAMGFRDIAPYLDYPERFLPYLVFMERTL